MTAELVEPTAEEPELAECCVSAGEVEVFGTLLNRNILPPEIDQSMAISTAKVLVRQR